MKTVIKFLILSICIVLNTYGQSFDPKVNNLLQNKLDSIRIKLTIKGISASIIYPNKGKWQGVSGISHPDNPITPDMEFAIASNTKLFTGVIILKLTEKGLVTLNDSVKKWLPTYQYVNPNITIRQLLNHTSGVADITNTIGYTDTILANPNRIFTPHEVVSKINPPEFKAGTSWSYSNTNYILAGMIAEKATGKKYIELLHEYILSPLALDSTFLDVYEKVNGTIAHPWQNGIDQILFGRNALNSAAWATGAMYSTANEMTQWYDALMNGGILNKNSMNEMTTFVGSGKYGIGISETEIDGSIIWQHGGSILGYTSFMMYDKITKVSLAVLTNQNPAQPSTVAKVLLSALYNNPLLGVENNLDDTNIDIYPNPSSDKINIGISNDKIIQIRIYNQLGELVKECKNSELSISDIAKGNYLIQITTDKGLVNKKLIKK